MSALRGVSHVVVGGGPNLVCHWPREGGIWRWGDELLVGYIEAPCEYTDPQQVSHALGGIWKRAYVRLRRSLDGGLTWSDAGKVFDHTLTVEQQRQVLRLDDYDAHVGPPREDIDMTPQDAILIMGRAWCGPESTEADGSTRRDNVVYSFRSADRGRRWEEVPSIVWPRHNRTVIEIANNYLKLGGSRLVCWVVGLDVVNGTGPTGAAAPQLYASDDHGVTWTPYAEICHDPTGRIHYSYPHVLALPSGRWLCFLGSWHVAGGSRVRWTSLCYSDDEGLNWSQPRKIHAWSVSPFPMRLDDGRIVMIYMRRNPDPTGLYAIVSEDEGLHWSKPLCIRDDTLPSGPLGWTDGGYPVAVQLDDGRIFVAYYWQHDDADVPWHGGRKYIGGTTFSLD